MKKKIKKFFSECLFFVSPRASYSSDVLVFCKSFCLSHFRDACFLWVPSLLTTSSRLFFVSPLASRNSEVLVFVRPFTLTFLVCLFFVSPLASHNLNMLIFRWFPWLSQFQGAFFVSPLDSQSLCRACLLLFSLPLTIPGCLFIVSPLAFHTFVVLVFVISLTSRNSKYRQHQLTIHPMKMRSMIDTANKVRLTDWVLKITTVVFLSTDSFYI